MSYELTIALYIKIRKVLQTNKRTAQKTSGESCNSSGAANKAVRKRERKHRKQGLEKGYHGRVIKYISRRTEKRQPFISVERTTLLPGRLSYQLATGVHTTRTRTSLTDIFRCGASVCDAKYTRYIHIL